MNRSQANRSVIAARATRSTPNLTAFPFGSPTPVYATGPVRRSSAVKLTATQRNSEGRTSEWNMSMDYFTDPKWSQTVSSTNV